MRYYYHSQRTKGNNIMCTTVTQIIETEARIRQAITTGAPQAEIDQLKREVEALDKRLDKERGYKPEDEFAGLRVIGQAILDAAPKKEMTNRELDENYLLVNKHSTQEEINKMLDIELEELVAHLIEEGVY